MNEEVVRRINGKEGEQFIQFSSSDHHILTQGSQGLMEKQEINDGRRRRNMSICHPDKCEAVEHDCDQTTGSSRSGRQGAADVNPSETRRLR
ncbi:hypothetical protein INR49_003680 [Caranx melampygus]|nr:hypothetical protein INR49_003680 [Caranx melampygus]